jgi:plastocyanin
MNRIAYSKIFAVIGTVVLLFSCDGNNSTQPVDNSVRIRDDFFEPETVDIGVGHFVVWRQFGANNHTVTSGSPVSNPGGLFDSGVLPPGSSFQFTFDAPGTYIYFCRIHGVAMSGTVNVH